MARRKRGRSSGKASKGSGNNRRTVSVPKAGTVLKPTASLGGSTKPPFVGGPTT